MNPPASPSRSNPAHALDSLRPAMLAYFQSAQDLTPGPYHGSFWSEKAYHGPQLDFHAGGAHHHRGAGSAALALHLANDDPACPMKRQAEWAFDWLTSRQHPSGGFQEVQNNDRFSDWEGTGLEECSTIATAFALRGMALALLHGLPPKAAYARCLRDAALWQIGIEWPAGSGVFPHHDRSPYNCLNANAHAAEWLMAAYRALRDIYHQPINLLLEAARRATLNTLEHQHSEGHFPYRAGGGVTINYTAIVMWCLLNVFDLAPEHSWAARLEARPAFERAGTFLRESFHPETGFDWQARETSTARGNMHTYLLTWNILQRLGGEQNQRAADAIARFLLARRTDSGLLPVKDSGEVITHCLPMQADMCLCLYANPENRKT